MPDQPTQSRGLPSLRHRGEHRRRHRHRHRHLRTRRPTDPPVANDDESRNNTPGTPVTVDPLENDNGDFDPSTVVIRDPNTGEWVKRVVVEDEGDWTVDEDGKITFTPNQGFEGDPTPIVYRVTGRDGTPVEARIVITYLDTSPTTPARRRDPTIRSPTGGESTLWVLTIASGLIGIGILLTWRRKSATTGQHRAR